MYALVLIHMLKSNQVSQISHINLTVINVIFSNKFAGIVKVQELKVSIC